MLEPELELEPDSDSEPDVSDRISPITGIVTVVVIPPVIVCSSTSCVSNSWEFCGDFDAAEVIHVALRLDRITIAKDNKTNNFIGRFIGLTPSLLIIQRH